MYIYKIQVISYIEAYLLTEDIIIVWIYTKYSDSSWENRSWQSNSDKSLYIKYNNEISILICYQYYHCLLLITVR